MNLKSHASVRSLQHNLEGSCRGHDVALLGPVEVSSVHVSHAGAVGGGDGAHLGAAVLGVLSVHLDWRGTAPV